MNRKGLFVISLVLMFSLLLAACGGVTGQETPMATEPGAPEPTQPIEEPTAPVVEEPTEPMEEPTEPMEEPTEAGEEPTEEGTQPTVSGEIDCLDAQEGDEISMLYQWSGTEEENLNAILQPFLDACGVSIAAESTRDQALLDTRVQAGNPPDIAFWNIAQLEQYQNELVPLEDMPIATENYSDFWRDLGSIGGTWFGLPVKADVKSIIWYSPQAFEAFGYTVPETWADLEALVEQMVADGNVPWSLGFESGDATGWTGSDFIQDILLVQQGPDYVFGLMDGSISYDDEGVRQAYETYGQWARDPQYTIGGPDGVLSTDFNDAILAVFADPPQAMMVKQSGFAAGTIEANIPELEFGVDYDFFMVPEVQGLQGGTDWMMAFSDEPAVQALFAYLSSEAGAGSWAQVGFDITPNQAAAGQFVDEALAQRADLLYNAETLVPDLGDTIPGGFGSAEWSAIIEYVSGSDLDTVLPGPAQAQREAMEAQ